MDWIFLFQTAAIPARVCICFDSKQSISTWSVSVKMFQRFCSHSAWEWKQNLEVLQDWVIILCLAVIKTIVTGNKTQKRNTWKTLGTCRFRTLPDTMLHICCPPLKPNIWIFGSYYTICFEGYLAFIEEELISCLSIFLLVHGNTCL